MREDPPKISPKKYLAARGVILYDYIPRTTKGRRIAIFIIAFLFLIVFSVVTDCLAQPNWSLNPSLTISETYDSNIVLRSRTTAVEDYITRTGLKLDPTYKGSSIGINGTYLVQFNAFARNPAVNVVTQNGSFNIDLNRWLQTLIKRSDITVTEDFTLTPELQSYYFDESRGQIGSLSSLGVMTQRSDAFRNAFRLDVSSPVTKRAKLTISYSNLLTDYRKPEFKDNMTNTGEFEIRYGFPRDEVYSNAAVSNARIGTVDSNLYSLIFGVKHSISAVTTLDVNAGILTLNREGRNNYSTLKGGVVLTKRSNTHIYSAGYSRGSNTVSGISVVPIVADIFYISMTNIHSETLTSNIETYYAMNRSTGENAVDTRSYNLSGGLNYTIKKWLRGSLTASHFDQESKRATAIDIKRNLITVALTGMWN